MAAETRERGGRARRVRRRCVGSITKRVRERADGTKQTIYRVQVPHPTAPSTSGRKLEKVCYSKSEATKWRDGMLRQVTDGTWVDPKARAEAPTVADLAKSWERTWGREGIKPKTALNWRAILKARVLPKWGETPAGEVKARDVQHWIAELNRSGLAPQTTKHAYNVLRAVLKHGVFEGALEVNPCNSDSVAMPKMRRNGTNGNALSLAEMHELVEAMPEHWQLPVELAARFGLRAAELWGVTRADIDLGANELHVRQTLSDVGGKLVVTDAKTEGSHRTYALAPRLRDRLAAHLEKPAVKHREMVDRKVVAHGYAALVGEGVRLVSDVSDDRRLVFTTPSGAPVQHSNFYRRVYLDNKPRGDRPSFHVLRHSCATDKRTHAGWSTLDVAMWLGHSLPGMTDGLYANHPLDEWRSELAQRDEERWERG